MDQEKNNLMQEELLLREQTPTEVPPVIGENLDKFIYSLEYRSEEGVLRKFAFGYAISSLVLLFFFHQLGAGFLSFDIGSVLNFMGPVFKQIIIGICFGTITVSSVLVVSFDAQEKDLLLAIKDKAVYSLLFFSCLFFAMFGNEFSWAGAFLWFVGASFGAGIGLNVGVNYIDEKNKNSNP